MSDAAQGLFFFSSEREDEFDEDIDNYDNERFNVYDDGIGLFEKTAWTSWKKTMTI